MGNFYIVYKGHRINGKVNIKIVKINDFNVNIKYVI